MVIVFFVSGFVCIIGFVCWEMFFNVKYFFCFLCIFCFYNGCEFIVFFILVFIVIMFYYGINIIYLIMINVFYVGLIILCSEELFFSLLGNFGFVFGVVFFLCFGNFIGYWKWMFIGFWIGLFIFGGLFVFVIFYNKGMMIVFCFFEQMFFGWVQYESIVFIQFGVRQIDLGILGGLVGVV